MGAGVSVEIVKAGFEPEGDFSDNNCHGWPQPSAFIQWKGTDVCMDFHCQCGAFCHFDGDFAYLVRCQHCGVVWQMPSTVYPRVASADALKDNPNVRDLDVDEEHADDDGLPLPISEDVRS